MPRITYKIAGYRIYSQLTEGTAFTFQDLVKYLFLFICGIKIDTNSS